MIAVAKTAEEIMAEFKLGHPRPDETCEKEYLVEGDWCEEACTKPTSVLAGVSGLKPGICKEQGFIVSKGALKQAVFAMGSSRFPGAEFMNRDFLDGAGCNPHYVVKKEICEGFCVGRTPHEVTYQIKYGLPTAPSAYAEHRSGMMKGTCSNNGYPKFMGFGRSHTFVTP